MFMLVLALLSSTLYFSLAPYPLTLTSGPWLIQTNLALALLTFVASLSFFMALLLQIFSVKSFLQALQKRRLERQVMRLEEKRDFCYQAHTFLISLSKDFSLSQVLEARDYLDSSDYCPGRSFKQDTQSWAKAVRDEDFKAAFAIIRSAQPYLPYQYAQLWRVKTLQAQLNTVQDENTLRVVQSRIPKIYLYEPVLRTILLLKISLYRQKHQAWKYLKNLEPKALTVQESQILFEWMRVDAAFWYQKLRQKWSNSQNESTYTSLLLCKLALFTGNTIEAKSFLEKIPASNERFYLEHTLSLKADQRLESLTS